MLCGKRSSWAGGRPQLWFSKTAQVKKMTVNVLVKSVDDTMLGKVVTREEG